MSSVPLVLFGAYDRHNFGDILLGQAAVESVAPRPVIFAGLRAADLTAWGGFRVEPLNEVIARWRRRFGISPLEILHVGGEILDTDAWEAAVMLLDSDKAPGIISRLDNDPPRRSAWTASFLNTGRPAPYLVGRKDLPDESHVEIRAAGGVGLGRRDFVFAKAVANAMAGADQATVRDLRTRKALDDLVLAVELAPDPVTSLGSWIAGMVSVPPIEGPYVAFQCAAIFGDEDTQAGLAAALDSLGLPVVAFRAGAAPWHDDLSVFHSLERRLTVPFSVVQSLHVRDICSAIFHARVCVASSLHALLVAGTQGIPAIGLERQVGEGNKLRAYAETWGNFPVLNPFELGMFFRSQQRL